MSVTVGTACGSCQSSAEINYVISLINLWCLAPVLETCLFAHLSPQCHKCRLQPTSLDSHTDHLQGDICHSHNPHHTLPHSLHHMYLGHILWTHADRHITLYSILSAYFGKMRNEKTGLWYEHKGYINCILRPRCAPETEQDCTHISTVLLSVALKQTHPVDRLVASIQLYTADMVCLFHSLSHCTKNS